MTTTLSERGQIVIPKSVRESQDFKPGDDFEVFQEPGSVILKKINKKRNKSLAAYLRSCPYKGWLVLPVRDPNNSRNK